MTDALDMTVKKRSIEPLRERVYEYLKGRINEHTLRAGEYLDLDRIGSVLEMSRTPLRDALFQLETEGFITIYPRRGVMVNVLDLKTIRNIYEIIGALESAVLVSAAMKFSEGDVRRMDALNDSMSASLSRGDYAAYYDMNVEFHNVFLDMSDNAELVRYARIQRERLYDFPRTRGFLPEWEESNLREHREMVSFLEAGNFNAAAEYLRDVHWSFSVQERFIRKYYFALKRD
jgi:DNA-binding GntR family transcriptional regulator